MNAKIKLSKEEINILKEHYSLGYMYLCRDKDRSLFFYYSPFVLFRKTSGHKWQGTTHARRCDNTELFEFVQWEDEEPFNFSDLFEVVYKPKLDCYGNMYWAIDDTLNVIKDHVCNNCCFSKKCLETTLDRKRIEHGSK